MKKRNNRLFLKGGLGSSSITWEWHQCGERVKSKSQKVGANFYLCRSYREKTGMGVGLFCPPLFSKFWIGLDRTKTAVLKFVDLVIKNVSDMQTLPITAGDSHFGRFNLSPIRFLESNSNSDFTEIYTLKFPKWHIIDRNSILEPSNVVLGDFEFCLHLSWIFRLLPCKIRTVEKVKTYEKKK